MEDVTAVLEDRPGDPGGRRSDFGRVVRPRRRPGDGKDAGLLVDEVVEALHQRLLGADAVVDGLRRHARGFGNVANARPGVPPVREEAPGGLEDLRLRELCLTFSQAGWLVGHVPLSIT